MTPEEILEGNKLIARFLGYDYYGHNDPRLEGKYQPGWKTHPHATNQVKYNKFVEKLSNIRLETKGIVEQKKEYSEKVEQVRREMIHFRYLCRKHEELRYHRSLDALEEVLRKMEALDWVHYTELYMERDFGYEFKISTEFDPGFIEPTIRTFSKNSRIEVIWLGVVEFIKFYNDESTRTADQGEGEAHPE